MAHKSSCSRLDMVCNTDSLLSIRFQSPHIHCHLTIGEMSVEVGWEALSPVALPDTTNTKNYKVLCAP